MLKWNKEMQQIHDGLGGKVRLVGGAIRDHLAGLPIKDYDFCTPILAEDAIKMLWDAENDIGDIIATGMAHGTFTVVFYKTGNRYEVTTLRKDVECDGRHAKVEFTDNYMIDAARRDFTYNAMSMDIDGTLYDYFGGAQDLANGHTVFCGPPALRIKEDYLRIMRFFRFAARFGFDIDHPSCRDAINAIKEHVEGLQQVSVERIWSEMQRLLNEPWEHVHPVMVAMQNSGVFRNTPLTGGFDVQSTQVLEALQCFETPATKLAKLWPLNDVKRNAEALKWSKEDTDRAVYVHTHYPLPIAWAKYQLAVKKARFDWVEEACDLNVNITEIQNWKLPTFPITGEHLLARGLKGKTIGLVLARLKDMWADSDFTLTEKELLCLVD